MSVKTEVIGHYTVKYNHMGARVFYTHSGEMADGTIFPNKDAAIAWIEQFFGKGLQRKEERPISRRLKNIITPSNQ